MRVSLTSFGLRSRLVAAVLMGAALLVGAGGAGAQVSFAPSSFVFNSTAALPIPAPQVLSITNNGSTAVNPFSLPIAYAPGEPTAWLQVPGVPSVLAPNTTYNVTLSIHLGSLPSGTYHATLGAIPVVLSVEGPTMVLSTSSLAFASTAAIPNPASQTITLSNSGSSILSAVTIGPVIYVVGQPTGWLQVNGNVTTLPNVPPGQSTAVPVVAKPGSIRAGTYSATFELRSGNATNSPQLVSATFTIAGPTIGLSPSTLAFASTSATPNPVGQTITLSNIGSSTLTGVTLGPIVYGAGQPTGWMQVNGNVTTLPNLPAGQSNSIPVAMIVGALPAGTYSASFEVRAGNATNSPQLASVTLTVAGPTIGLSPSSLNFSATAATPNPAGQVVTLSNVGSSTMTGVTLGPVVYGAGQPTGWMQVNGNVTTLPDLTAGQNTAVPVAVTVGSLPAGVYSATFEARGGNATNSPQLVTVSLLIVAPSIAASPASVAFAALTGSSVPSPATVTLSNGGAGTIGTLTLTGVSYQGPINNWLTIGFSAGAAPLPITVTVATTAVPAGVYSATIDVASDQAGVAPLSIPVSFTVTQAPTIVLSTMTATFNATPGGVLPSAAAIDVTAGGSGVLDALSVAGISYGAGQSTGWLTASLAGAAAPTQLQLQPNTTALTPAQTYSASVELASGAAGVTNSPQTVTVTYTMAGIAQIVAFDGATPVTSVVYQASTQALTPPPTSLSIQNTGSAVTDLTISAPAYAAGEPTGWLQFDATPATILPSGAVTRVAQADASGLAPGTYSASVTLNGTNGATPLTLDFALTVTAPAIAITPGSVSFTATSGGAPPPGDTVVVTNSGGAGTIDGLAIQQITYSPGATGWLQATPVVSSAPAPIALAILTTALPPGMYTAQVTVASSSAGVLNNPATFSVSFAVSAPPVAPTIALSASSAALNATAGGPASSPVSINITNSGTGPLDGLSVSGIGYGAGGSGWLSATLGGTIAPTTLSLVATPGTLPPGSYSATVTLASTASGVTNSPVMLPVTFVVTTPPLAPTIALSTTSVALTAVVGGVASTPTTVNVTNAGTGTLDGLAVAGIGYGAGGSGWLTATLNATTAPTTLVLVGTPGALAGGTYTATVFLSSIAGGVTNSPRPLAVTFSVTPSAAALIVLSTTALNYTVGAGSGTSAAQVVDINNGGTNALTGLSTVITYTAGQPAGWMRVALSATTAPAAASVNVVAASTLAAGTYTATLRVRSSLANVAARDVVVTFTVSGAAPNTVVAPTALAFSGAPGSGVTPYQLLDVTNGGGGTLTGLSTRLVYPAGGPSGWLQATLSATVAPATVQARSTIGVALAVGTYSATLEVRSTVGTTPIVSIPVTLTVSGALPAVALSRRTVTIAAAPNAALPSPEIVSVSNGGSGVLSGLTTRITYAAGGPTGWLRATLGATLAPTTVSLRPSTTALAAGSYHATVVLSAPGGAASDSAAVTYNVQPATGPAIALSAGALSFNATAGGTPPAAQTVTVNNGGTGTLNQLSVGAITDAVGAPIGWVTAAFNVATAPATLTVQVAPPAGVAAGRYVASIPVVSPVASNSPNIVLVTINVPPPTLAVSPNTLTFAAATGSGVTPAQVVSVTEPNGNPVSGASVQLAYTAGQPTGWATATLSRTVLPATVAITANAGPSLAAGTYTATASVSATGIVGATQVVVTLTVTGGTPIIAFSRGSVPFLLAPNSGVSPFETVNITNAGPGTISGLALRTNYTTGQPTGWLRTTLSGITTPASVTLSVVTGTLAYGQYGATVTVSGTGVVSQVIAVTLTIGRPIIAAAPSSILLPVQQGTTAAAVIAVTNGGPGALTGLQAGPLSDYFTGLPVPWAMAALNTTTAPATVTITANPGVAIPPGAYQLRFDLSSPVASNSPFAFYSINVTVIDQTVTPTGAIIAVSPGSAALSAAQGSTGTATLAVSNAAPGTTLAGLSAGSFSNFSSGQPAPWVTAALDQTTAPATLTITAAPDATIPLGTTQLRFAIFSAGASNSPYTVYAVNVTVTAPVATTVAGDGAHLLETPETLVRAARDLLGEESLTPAERTALDRLGNHDGRYDVGDLVAALDRTDATIPLELLQRALAAPRASPAPKPVKRIRP